MQNKYNKETIDQALILCSKSQKYIHIFRCLECPWLPCPKAEEYILLLKDSEFVTRKFSQFKVRRAKMQIAKLNDGTLKPVDIDVNDPQISELENVEEIYIVSKILIPQMKLVPKPKEERENIKNKNLDKKKDNKTES